MCVSPVGVSNTRAFDMRVFGDLCRGMGTKAGQRGREDGISNLIFVMGKLPGSLR